MLFFTGKPDTKCPHSALILNLHYLLSSPRMPYLTFLLINRIYLSVLPLYYIGTPKNDDRRPYREGGF